jgi:hypothetical protein
MAFRNVRSIGATQSVTHQFGVTSIRSCLNPHSSLTRELVFRFKALRLNARYSISPSEGKPRRPATSRAKPLRLCRR